MPEIIYNTRYRLPQGCDHYHFGPTDTRQCSGRPDNREQTILETADNGATWQIYSPPPPEPDPRPYDAWGKPRIPDLEEPAK